MAGLLAFPQFTSLMSGMSPAAMTKPRPMMADAEDERMFAANPNGDQLNQLLGALLLGQKEAPGMAPQAAPQAQAPMPSPAVQAAPGGAVSTPQRGRVSGWRVLDRVLGGETITGGLDAERARLQAEAERPQLAADNARIQAAIRNLPIEQQLAIRLNGEKAGEAFSSQFTDRTAAAGTSVVRGNQAIYTTPTTTFADDRFATFTPGQGVEYTAPRTSTFAEDTARAKAEADAAIARGELDVKQLVANRPEVTTLAPGAEAVFSDVAGNVTGRTASTQARPMSDSDQKAVAEAELAVEKSSQAVSRAQRIRQQIASGDLRLGLVERGGAAFETLTGNASPNALAIADLEQWAKQARDAILASNTGVQTDQDAIRALDNVLANMNDEKLVIQYLDQFITATTGTQRVFERDIARRSGSQGAPAAGGPTVGTVEDGYRYVGGPPGNPSSWERVQ